MKNKQFKPQKFRHLVGMPKISKNKRTAKKNNKRVITKSQLLPFALARLFCKSLVQRLSQK